MQTSSFEETHGGLKKVIPTNSVFYGAPTRAIKKGYTAIVWYFHDVIC